MAAMAFFCFDVSPSQRALAAVGSIAGSGVERDDCDYGRGAGFCKAVVAVFGPEYLREPTIADTERLLAGQYKGHVKGDTVILEAVASQDLWIWHSFFGMVGSHNDTSVLQCSPVFARLTEGHCLEVSFDLNGHQYNKGYYLADGIYPRWSTLMKTIPNPQGEKR
ncbi:uncharacterized protein [Aegilops tauschii subsp. strangulata]|uniref:uncharacterized protein n=1 Tax=Aegilops tauschii subsp. strangulata TaxID=200361 RepID=UPI00098A52C5|nr:uncharacterized protein LOC109783138 [Aegilops tauschii subsp. strangulata]